MNDNTPMLPTRSDAWMAPPPEERGVRDAAITLREQAPLAIAVFLCVLLLGAAYAVFTTPVYRADTLVQVEERGSTTLAPSGIGAISSSNLPSTPAGLQGEIEIFKSRELLLKAIAQTRADLHVTVANRLPLIGTWLARMHEQRDAGLASAPLGLSQFAWGGERVDLKTFDVPESAYGQTFKLVTTQGGWQLFDEFDTKVAQGALNQPVDFKLANAAGRIEVASVVGRSGAKFDIRRDSPLVTLEELIERLKVTETTRQSGVIRATFEDSDRQFAIQLLDRLGRNYVDYAAQQRTLETERSLRFLEEQIPIVMRELSQAEEKLSSFRVTTGTVDVEEETRSSFQRLNQLERDRVDLQVRRRQLSQRFEDNHPEVRSVDQQIGVLANAINQLNGQVNTLPNSQREYLRLQRDVNTNGQLYIALLNNMQQLRVARAAVSGNAHVADTSGASEKPVRPKPMIAMSIAGGLGLLLAVLSAFFARTMHSALRDPDDVERLTGVPAIVSIPDSARQRRLMRMPIMPWLQGLARNRLLTLRAPGEPAVETLRSLHMTLALSAQGREKRSILIASPTGGVGKTFISANLAALMTAPSGGTGPQRRVLLIEADLRRPRLQNYFGLPPGAGLAEVATSDVTFDQVVRRDVLPNLDLLLPGKPAGNPADALMSPKLRELLASLELRYDVILIDSAPVLPVGDTLAIAPFAMATYLVAQADVTTTRELRESIRRLQSVGARVEGVLFNGVPETRSAGAYDYRYLKTA